MKKNSIQEQLIPIILTLVTFFVFGIILHSFISLLNLFPLKNKILLVLRPADVLVGITIYLKTSIDFALFIGNQMKQNPGWKNRIAIEIGTALGNGIGTIIVLTIWTFFKEVPLLMVIMITIAALVLFRMAEDSLREYQISNTKYQIPNLFIRYWILDIRHWIFILNKINAFFSPLIEKLLPHTTQQNSGKKTFTSLLIFSLTIPFVLGLDDFAGYIPLFSIINVFGFAIGVLFGHMILNLLLFASPSFTIKLVKQPIIMILGSIAFIGIGLWGLYEVGQIVAHLIIH